VCSFAVCYALLLRSRVSRPKVRTSASIVATLRSAETNFPFCRRLLPGGCARGSAVRCPQLPHVFFLRQRGCPRSYSRCRGGGCTHRSPQRGRRLRPSAERPPERGRPVQLLRASAARAAPEGCREAAAGAACGGCVEGCCCCARGARGTGSGRTRARCRACRGPARCGGGQGGGARGALVRGCARQEAAHAAVGRQGARALARGQLRRRNWPL
jgi:hypothetical protein